MANGYSNTTNTNQQLNIDNTNSGSNQSFPLSKEVLSNQAAKDKIAESFKEITISEEKFDSEKIKGIYNDLFYLIPKKGKKSHTTIIEQSTDYVYPEINENLEDSISAKGEILEELNELYLSSSLGEIEKMHPIYDNGILVQEGVDGVAIDPNSDIWYLQQGFKRKLGRNSTGGVNGYWHRLLRQTNGEEVYTQEGSYNGLYNSPTFRLLTPEELNIIPNGEDIDSGDDLNIKVITDQGDDFIFSEIKLVLKCVGVERFYKFKEGEEGYDYDLSGYPETGGYWYVDTNGSCKVRVSNDTDPTEEYGAKQKSYTIPGGTSLKIIISRDEKWYGHTINGTSNPLDSEFYEQSKDAHVIEETRKAYGRDVPPLGVFKKWGEGSSFPSIVSVSQGSRINYRIRSPYNTSGTPVDGDGKSHRLYGIIDGQGTGLHGYDNQKGMLDSYYDNRESNFETTMINRECYGPQDVNGCYGALEQSENLQTLLNDPANKYYMPFHDGDNKKFRIYGQPILKVNGDYCVFIRRFRTGWAFPIDWNTFFRLRDGKTFDVKNKHLDNEVHGYTRYSTKWFTWSEEDNYSEGIGFFDMQTQSHLHVNNPKIYFPGIKGVKLNTSGTDREGLESWDGDNPFNPSREFSGASYQGSNYEVTYLMRKRTKRG